MQQQDNHEYPFLYQRQTCHQVQPNQATYQKRQKCQPATYLQEVLYQLRSEERRVGKECRSQGGQYQAKKHKERHEHAPEQCIWQYYLSYFSTVIVLFLFKQKAAYEIGLGIPAEPLFRSQQQDNHEYPFLYQRQTCHQVQPNQATYQKRQKCQPATYLQEVLYQL